MRDEAEPRHEEPLTDSGPREATFSPSHITDACAEVQIIFPNIDVNIVHIRTYGDLPSARRAEGRAPTDRDEFEVGLVAR